MSEVKHTPGPWVWLDRGDWHELVHFVPGEWFPNATQRYIRVHSDGSAGGEYSPDIQHDGPDGRLIAASPALLAALIELYDATSTNNQDKILAARATARRAMGQAEPQQQQGGVR